MNTCEEAREAREALQKAYDELSNKTKGSEEFQEVFDGISLALDYFEALPDDE